MAARAAAPALFLGERKLVKAASSAVRSRDMICPRGDMPACALGLAALPLLHGRAINRKVV